MAISVTENNFGETEVFVTDGDEPNDGGDYNGLRIHPWRRKNYTGDIGDEVYVAAMYTKDQEGRIPSPDGDADEYGNVILSAEDFIEAVLAAFPDRLQRKEQA